MAEKFREILKLRVTGLNSFESYFAQIYFSDHPSEKLILIFSGIKQTRSLQKIQIARFGAVI